MQDNLGFVNMPDNLIKQTLYDLATKAMLHYIPIYLELTDSSKGFTDLKEEH